MSGPIAEGAVPELWRELTETEQHVVWACLWANVRDVHQPVFNMDEAQHQVGEALLVALDVRLADGTMSAAEREIAYSLAHGVAETDQGSGGDWELAERVGDYFTSVLDARHGHSSS